MSREEILEKLRRTGTGQEVSALPPSLPDFPVFSDLVDEFRRRLEIVGGIFLDGRGSELLLTALDVVRNAIDVEEFWWEGIEVLDRHGIPHQLLDSPKGAARGPARTPLRLPLSYPLPVESTGYEFSTLPALPMVISSAELGVAETGSVVLSTGTSKQRVLPSLVPHHVVMLSEGRLAHNHRELYTGIIPGEAGSAQIIVTGPSRTADIEKTLIVGVHGPGTLHVILTV